MTAILPKGTTRLLLRQLRGSPSGTADLVDWAVRALESGFDSPALRVLAGLDVGGPANGFEAEEKFRAACSELQVTSSGEGELLSAVTCEVARDIVVGATSPQHGVEIIHREVLSPFGHPEEFMPWCHLLGGAASGDVRQPCGTGTG